MKFFLVCAAVGVLVCPAFLQTKTPPAKTTATKPKTTATPTKKPVQPVPDDKSEWERVTAIADRSARITALEGFIAAFPKSAHLSEAAGLVAAARVEAGNDDVAANNVDDAISEYKAAIAIAPTPVVQGFWDAGLSKIPANVYFRDHAPAAIEIAKLLEAKAGDNGAQLLSLTTFYLTIEDGADAKRIAEKVIAAEPASAPAYRMLGLADRMVFRLDDSASAFAKALEIEPASVEAKQGLAEMKRALGHADEALALYDELVAKDPENMAARTGRVLSLFDAEKRADAEAEMAKVLADSPGNVILLGEAAYWYAAHKDGEKAVELAQKAIAQNPRFIWSHIALARGYLLEGKPADAERTLLGARRYGNFPTLDYELAATRLAGGFYREAAEVLSTSFKAKGGSVSTDLGGRIPRESKLFTELVADERRASIFAPTAADDADTAAHLAALLEFYQELKAPTPDENAVSAAADSFVKGDDPMRVHRQLYAASELLDRKLALPKVVELAKAAVENVDVAVGSPSASTAVMAGELYSPRAIAATRGEYVNVPDVPRATLSAIVRGRIEDMMGWAAYQTGATDDAVLHLRRAVSVLPADSAWWRASTWHLGAALALSGKDAEALDAYIRSYKGSSPDALRYSIIDALYRRVNGSADGLVDKIGENPAQAVAQATPAPTVTPEATPTPAPTPAPTPDMVSAIPIATPSATPTPEPTPSATPAPSPTVEATPSATPTPEASPSLEATPVATPTPDATPAPSPTPGDKAEAKTKELFPPVIITIPPHPKAEETPTPSPTPTPSESPRPVPSPSSLEQATSAQEVPACSLTVSEASITLKRGGGDLAVIVGREDDVDLEGLDATSSSEADVTVRRESIAGVKSRAIYALRSVSDKAGVYQVTFRLPCGTKTVEVNVH